jgi:hypothetical protein
MTPPRFLLPPDQTCCMATLLDILERSDVLILRKLLSLSQVICWSCSDLRLNAVG